MWPFSMHLSRVLGLWFIPAVPVLGGVEINPQDLSGSTVAFASADSIGVDTWASLGQGQTVQCMPLMVTGKYADKTNQGHSLCQASLQALRKLFRGLLSSGPSWGGLLLSLVGRVEVT